MSRNIESQVDIVKSPWSSSPYYEDAEKWTHLFWNSESIFYRRFVSLDLTTTIELACGHGRHSEIVGPHAKRLIMVDVFDDNLNFCRSRLKHFQNIDYLLGNGHDYSPVPDQSVTAIYCYDAMVHFSMDIMLLYLKDTARVLRPGGYALYHHSNFIGPGAAHYGQNPHARNVMNFELYAKTAEKVRLEVVESDVLDWGGVKSLDRLTLLRKK